MVTSAALGGWGGGGGGGEVWWWLQARPGDRMKVAVKNGEGANGFI